MPAWTDQTAKDVRRDADNSREDRRVSKGLQRKFKKVERESNHLYERPQDADDVMLQLRRMLPAEGWLTERLARLREKIEHIRLGELGHVIEVQDALRHLPDVERARVTKELLDRYKELRFELKLEKLDQAVAQNERQIIGLTRQAEAHLANHNFRGLHAVLDAARKLQESNSRLFKLIDRLEQQIAHTAKAVTKDRREVGRG